MEDFTTVIEINPLYELAFTFRGNLKSGLNDLVGTIED